MLINKYRSSIGQEIPLSFSQKRIWFLQKLYDDNVMYNTLRCFRINGSLDMDALRVTLHTLAIRHEPLRSRLQIAQDGTPFQVMDKELQINIEHTDLRNTPEDEIEDRAKIIIQDAVVRPFNLYDEQMLRVASVSLSESQSILLFVKHHIITDFSSWRLFLDEFANIYTSFMKRQPLSMPPLKFQYSEFAKKQELLLTKENITNKQEYWSDFFAGCLNWEQTALTPSRPVTNEETPFYESAWQLIPSDTVKECKMLAQSRKCTLFIVILTAVSLLVSYLYRNSKVILCIANANRQLPGEEQMIGCFFTNIIISPNIRPERKLFELIDDVKEMFLHAWRQQDMPFEMFAEDLALECTRRRKPPYRIYISYRKSAHDIEFSLPNLHLEPMEFSTGRNTHEDIVFNFWEKMSEGELCLSLGWQWRTDLFDQGTIEKASKMLEFLLGEIKRDIYTDVQRLQEQIGRNWTEMYK